jgi:two-component system response regulator HydG
VEKILVVDDQRNMRATLALMLRGAGYEVEEAPDGEIGCGHGATGAHDLVITDLRMGDTSGLDVLRAVKKAFSLTEVIVMTAYGTVEDAVSAMKAGAFDFLSKPVDTDHLLLLVARALERRQLLLENILLREEYAARLGFPRILGEHPSIVEVGRQIQRVAPTDATVLIVGEGGTGKGLVARALSG